MSRHVIMFKGGVETQEFFSMQMAQTFEANGYTVYWFDLITSEQSAHLLRAFYEENSTKEFVVFTFNFNGIAGEDGLYWDNNSHNFWDEKRIPVFNMVVDHPLYYHKYLQIRPEKYVQISIDRNHVEYMKRFFPEVNVLIDECNQFIPLGGTGINTNNELIADKNYFKINERPIDIIFTGNYTPIDRFDKYLSNMDTDSANYYKELVQEAINSPDSLIEVLNEAKLSKELSKEGYVLTDTDLKLMNPNLMYVDLSVRFYYRAKVIAALTDSGLKVHTFGAGWNLLECKHPENIITAGSVDSRECLDKIFQSKISVNVMPWFKDGAHDRIFNSMLNGAVCVSDDSKYLRQIFEDDKDICFYSLKNVDEVVLKIKNLLADTEKMQNIADTAYEKCLRNHTWKKRAEQIIELMKLS